MYQEEEYQEPEPEKEDYHEWQELEPDHERQEPEPEEEEYHEWQEPEPDHERQEPELDADAIVVTTMPDGKRVRLGCSVSNYIVRNDINAIFEVRNIMLYGSRHNVFREIVERACERYRDVLSVACRVLSMTRMLNTSRQRSACADEFLAALNKSLFTGSVRGADPAQRIEKMRLKAEELASEYRTVVNAGFATDLPMTKFLVTDMPTDSMGLSMVGYDLPQSDCVAVIYFKHIGYTSDSVNLWQCKAVAALICRMAGVKIDEDDMDETGDYAQVRSPEECATGPLWGFITKHQLEEHEIPRHIGTITGGLFPLNRFALRRSAVRCKLLSEAQMSASCRVWTHEQSESEQDKNVAAASACLSVIAQIDDELRRHLGEKPDHVKSHLSVVARMARQVRFNGVCVVDVPRIRCNSTGDFAVGTTTFYSGTIPVFCVMSGVRDTDRISYVIGMYAIMLDFLRCTTSDGSMLTSMVHYFTGNVLVPLLMRDYSETGMYENVLNIFVSSLKSLYHTKLVADAYYAANGSVSSFKMIDISNVPVPTDIKTIDVSIRPRVPCGIDSCKRMWLISKGHK